MRERRQRPHHHDRPATTVPVPDSQSRALERRQSLNEQQHTFRGANPGPHFFRRRPPG